MPAEGLRERVTVVVNPAKVRHAARFRAVVDGALTARGLDPARYLLTTIDDPGAGQALAAVEGGATRLLVAGGDGTVRMVLGALRGTGVPVGLVPAGTGNLLARNLRLPLRLRPAVEAALDGAPRALDLIRDAELVTGGEGHAAVMAGLGADAAVVQDASEQLKRLGQAGYVLAGLRHIRSRPVPTQVTIDGEVLLRDASLVEVANLAELTRGVRLFLRSDPSDGVLEAMVASPRHAGHVLMMMAGVLLRARDLAHVERLPARTVVVHSESPVPCQVDGDVIGQVRAIRFEVEPGAATVVTR